MSHSPEPWGACYVSVDAYGQYFASDLTDANGESVVYPYSENEDAMVISKEDAERIVTCVNFCAGLSMDDLTRYGEGLARQPWKYHALDYASRLLRDCMTSVVKGEKSAPT